MDSSLIFDGKTYISVIRASKDFGYNSDYLGQLCRKSLVDCRRVGRLWFVNPESIKLHEQKAEESKKQNFESRRRSRVGLSNISSQSLKPGIDHGTNLVSSGVSTNVSKREISFHAPDVYINDLLKFDPESDRQDRGFRRNIFVATFFTIAIIFTFSSGVLNHNSLDNFNEVKFSSLSNVSKNIFSDSLNNLELISKYSTFASANILNSVGDWVGYQFDNAGAEISKRITRTYNSISELTPSLSGIFSSNKKTHITASSTKSSGLVVVPSTGDPDSDLSVKNYVKESFSDEAEVVPDESGSSGVIRPVFRSGDEQEYLYILVPVEDSGG